MTRKIQSGPLVFFDIPAKSCQASFSIIVLERKGSYLGKQTSSQFLSGVSNCPYNDNYILRLIIPSFTDQEFV